MKSILIIFLVTIVTTQLLEARQQPKVLVYEVTEADGQDPEVQLLKIEDLNRALKEDYEYQDQPLNRYKKYEKKNKKRHNSNRQSILADLYDIEKTEDSNRHKSHNKNNQYKSYKKLDSGYKNQKLTVNVYRNRDLENIFIDWDKQQSNKDDQEEINDYINRKLQQQEKKNVRNSKKKQKVRFDNDFFDLGEQRGNKEEDVLLSQLLKPLERQKREAEKASIIQRLKQLLARLNELDGKDKNHIEGKVYISKPGEANNWSLDSSELQDNSYYKKPAIQINRHPALRSGDDPVKMAEMALNLAEDEKFFRDVLGDDRTAPPPSNTKFENPEYE